MIEFLHTYGLMFLVGSWPNGPIGGFAGTILLAALGLAGAFPFAMLIGIARTGTGVTRMASTIWVYTFRSIPLIMIVFWAYFLLPVLLGTELPPFWIALAAIVVYESAFLAEIIRAGIQSVPQGQVEAARAVGLNTVQTLASVQLPQALSNMIPSLLNQFVSTIKATSIVYIIGVQEAAFAAQQINSIELTGALRTYLILALFYFFLCLVLSRLAKALENHLKDKQMGIIAQAS
ncbi:ABC transporter permease subunit [Parapusillimonas granuli]|uniref:Amino acid ABC transporter permease n=1 Tax=Parapusillimonas granuli TaxID=380911 RepID=A0A853FVR6_9BURK|nr:polar amino acid transport system permease protein [Parapusillimonas granuli]MEB2400406.1 amino acid ABC transporter permease [Alcaligenaceae bacterium]NYT47812.1 amino acid ABC transporter permease [Parapusillimonas granuli]